MSSDTQTAISEHDLNLVVTRALVPEEGEAVMARFQIEPSSFGFWIEYDDENLQVVFKLNPKSGRALFAEIRQLIFAETGEIVDYDDGYSDGGLAFTQSNKYVRETLTYEELNKRFPTGEPLSKEAARVIRTMALQCFSTEESIHAFNEFHAFIDFFCKKKQIKELYGVIVKHPPDLLERRDEHLKKMQELSAYEIPTRLLAEYRKMLNQLK